MTTLNVNGQEHTVEADPDTPILWALRDMLGLTDTKFGCGVALCGACTVLLDGQAIRSCSTPISAVEGRSITTVGAITDGSDRVGAAVHAALNRHHVDRGQDRHGDNETDDGPLSPGGHRGQADDR